MLKIKLSGRGLILGLVVVLLRLSVYAVDSQELLKQRDSLMKSGSIDFRRIDHKPNGDETTEEELVFDEDGRFKHTVHAPHRIDPEADEIIFVKGRTWRYLEKQGLKGTIIQFDDTAWPYDNDYRFFLVGRPCFPLGAGFGELKSVTKDPIKQTVSGLMKDGIGVKLNYSKLGSDFPSHIVRTWQGQDVNQWDLSGEVNAGPNLSIPARAAFIDRALKDNNRDFEIKKANFGKRPEESELTTEWYRPGVDIADNRVSPTVHWSYEELKTAFRGTKAFTPDDLLVLSRERASFFAKGDQAKRNLAANQQASGFVRLANVIKLFILILIVTFGAILMRRRIVKFVK